MNKKERRIKDSQKASRCCRKVRQAEANAYGPGERDWVDDSGVNRVVWRIPIYEDDLAHWYKVVPLLADKWLKYIAQYKGDKPLLNNEQLRIAVKDEIFRRNVLE